MEIELGSYVRCVLDFNTNVSGELPLTVGDIVRVEKQIDKYWLHGTKLGGVHGIFPKSFVTKLSIPKLHNQQKLFVAIETFPAQQHGDLGFVKGDLIVGIRKIDNNWLEGESNGRTGIFPSNFVREVPPPKTATSPVLGNGYPTHNSLEGASISGDGVKATVKTNLDAKLPEEISLRVGETVYIDEYVDKNWCRGHTADGRKGIFPKGFVEIASVSPVTAANHPSVSQPTKSASSVTVSSSKLPSPVPSYTAAVTSTRTSSPTVSQSKISDYNNAEEDIQPYGRTKYAFSAEYPEELSFTQNQIVKLIKHIDDEWTLGELNGKKGIFPTTYLDIIVDCPKVGDSQKMSFGGGRQEQHYEQFVVIYDFAGTVHGDLQARVNDRVGLLKTVNDSWIEGINYRTNSKGLIPLNFLKQVANDDQVTMKSVETRKNYVQERPRSMDEAIANNLANLEHGSSMVPKAKRAQEFTPVLNESSQSTRAQRLESNQQTPQTSLYPDISHVKQSSPPARPPTSPAITKPIREDLQQQRRQKEEQKKLEVRAQRTRIFQEIIQTERDYCNDLVVCQEVFSTYRNALDIDMLLAGLPSIVLLSKKLLHLLESEFGKDFVYQEIGTPFLTLQEEFKHVYSGFCETHEDAQALLDKYETEPPKQIVLKDCLQKIQHQTTCLDLSSLLSRPIQKVLKYPLFLSEVLKCTEDNQSDKVKLMMALKVMTEVAQCINETKRRKDLVSKYRKDGDSNFSERLSRLNMHTFRKKSSRFSMRFSTTIGLTQSVKDEEFDEIERQFRTVEKSCRNFVRDVQVYCEQMLMFYNQQMSVAESLHHGIGAKSAKTENYFDTWSRILFSDGTLQRFFDAVSEKIRYPVNAVQQTCKGPEKLILKRRDKMLDFEAASSRYEKEKSRGDSADPSKLRMSEEEWRKSRVEYEAMNNQLKTELPQLCSLAYDILSMATRAFVSAHRSWVYELGRQFQPLERIVGSFIGVETIFEQFVNKNQFVTNELAKLTFVPSSVTGVVSTSSFNRSPSIAKKSLDESRTSNKPNHIVFPQKPQSETDRQILRTKYQDKQLYSASCSYLPQNEMDLSLKSGDLVGVIINKDPMGNHNRWFVDNGVGKGFVPCNILHKFEDPSKNDQVVSQVNKTIAPSANGSSKIEGVRKLESPFIDQDQTYAKPTKRLDKVERNLANRPPITTRPPMSRSATVSTDKTVATAISRTSLEPVKAKLVPERPAPSPPTKATALQPIRSAPPPPILQKDNVRSDDERPSSVMSNVSDKAREKEDSGDEPMEFYVVQFDFPPRSDNELKLIEGQLVAVHAKQDLEHNVDWWLVENEDGEIGYVPANYLLPYKN